MTTNLYFIRHAQPINDTDLSSSKTSYLEKHRQDALSKLGYAQALITAQALQRFSIKVLFTSPLPRALETAKIISNNLELEVHARNDLTEQDRGKLLENVSPFEIPRKFPEIWQHLQSGDPFYAPPGGETTGAFLSRVERFLAEMEDISGSIAVVSHFGFIQGVVSIVLNLPFRYSMPLDIGESSITHLHLQKDNRILISLNETSHWETVLGIVSPSYRVDSL